MKNHATGTPSNGGDTPDSLFPIRTVASLTGVNATTDQWQTYERRLFNAVLRFDPAAPELTSTRH